MKTATLYVGYSSGGCQDIGELKLKGFRIISDARYKELLKIERAHIKSTRSK